jgi:hypothetical protein
MYRPRQAPSAPGGSGSQDFQTIDTWKWQGCQPYAPAAFTFQGRSMILTSVRGWVDPKAIVWPSGLSQWKISKIPSEIEPATSWLVALCLNQLRYRLPSWVGCSDSTGEETQCIPGFGEGTQKQSGHLEDLLRGYPGLFFWGKATYS